MLVSVKNGHFSVDIYHNQISNYFQNYPTNSLALLGQRPGYKNIQLAPSHFIVPNYPNLGNNPKSGKLKPRPATSRPSVPRPATSRPATSRPAPPRQATSRPAPPRQATSRPATPKPATSRPGTPRPVTPKLDTPKLETPKPATPNGGGYCPGASFQNCLGFCPPNENDEVFRNCVSNCVNQCPNS